MAVAEFDPTAAYVSVSEWVSSCTGIATSTSIIRSFMREYRAATRLAGMTRNRSVSGRAFDKVIQSRVAERLGGRIDAMPIRP